MKPVYWNDPDPRVRWGNPNLRWSSPASYLLEPGDEGYVELQPGDPGYVPPPPAPAPRRRGHRVSPGTYTPETQTTDPHTMPQSTFTLTSYPYVVQPTPNGDRFMPRAQYRGTKTTAEVVAEVLARIGQQTLTAELVIQTFLEAVLDFNKSGWKVEPMFDLMGFRFSCGNAFDDSSFPGTFDNLGIAPNCNLGETGLQRAQQDFTGEKVGEQPRVSAIFMSVTDTFTGDVDHYTPDKNLEIELANKRFKFDPANANHWVKFKKDDGTMVAGTDIYVRGCIILARVPAALAGNVELHLSCEINKSTRMSIYQNMLLP